MNKIVVYDKPSLTMGIAEYFNKELEIANKNEKITHLTFIQSDLKEQLINDTKFINDYKDFMTEYELPYIFFPYYVYFNKLLPNEMGKPNPRLEIKIKNSEKVVDVVCVPAYGFLMLDIQKLKSINFKFNEKYTELYHIQDLIQKCYENKLWISNCCFLDRYHSWEDLKEVTIKGHYVNSEKYKAEKEGYDKLGFKYHSLQDFINLFKERYKL